MTNQQQSEAFIRAMFAERAAWFALGNRYPGSPGHDAKLWNQWVAHVQTLTRVPQQFEQLAASEAAGTAMPQADERAAS